MVAVVVKLSTPVCLHCAECVSRGPVDFGSRYK